MKPLESPLKNDDLYPKGWCSKVPILRSILYGTRSQRYQNCFRHQLADRGPVPDSAWVNSERLAAARVIERILEENCWFEEFRFHPDDPYSIVGEWEIGDLSEVEALMAIEEQFGIEIEDDTMNKALGEAPTFGQFVDYVMGLASNKPAPGDAGMAPP
jgi:hypothetical protein